MSRMAAPSGKREHMMPTPTHRRAESDDEADADAQYARI
jgi:hypothetical protein